MQIRHKRILTAVAALALAVPIIAVTARRALSSDHADTPEIANAPGTDLTDVFLFPSPTNPDNVVLTMCVHPLIPTGGTASFDPNVLYEFKIDNNGDHVEDLVVQATFSSDGKYQISAPTKPKRTGTTSESIEPYRTAGTVGVPFSPAAGVQVFAGVREDPFFFDLEQFFNILPDRGSTVFPALTQTLAEANIPRATAWRAPGAARDFLIGLNLLAIVVELPKSALQGTGSGKIGLWCTTSK